MKYLLLIAVLLISSSAHAEVKASLLWSLPESETIDAHCVYQLEYSLHKNLSLYGSYEKMLVRYAGQEAYDTKIGALGFRGQTTWKNITLILTVGGYFPSVERKLASSEALSYEINRTVGAGNVAKQEDHYSVELKNAIGGGISVVVVLASKWDLTVGYRFLKFEEVIMARGDHFYPGHWEIFMQRNYSGPFVGILYEF